MPEPKQGKDREIRMEEKLAGESPAHGEPLSTVEMEKELARIETGREARLLAKYGVPETLQVPTPPLHWQFRPMSPQAPPSAIRPPVC